MAAFETSGHTPWLSASLPGSNSMPELEAASRNPEVQQAMQRLERGVEQLAEACKAMDMRLQSVVRHEPEQGESANVKEAPFKAPLASQIQEYARRITELVDALHDLRGRVEL